MSAVKHSSNIYCSPKFHGFEDAFSHLWMEHDKVMMIQIKPDQPLVLY